MSAKPLDGLRVVDLTHYVAGPYCTKLLADYGAEVIKIEKPGKGDGARHLGPFPEDAPHPEKSGIFLYLNTNKKSVTLNLKSSMGVKVFKELLATADVLVENFHPRVMPGLGLGYEALEAVRPDLVMTSISNFGQDGPYRDFKADENVEAAMAMWMNSLGEPSREPLRPAGNQSQYVAGSYGAVGTMMALSYRDLAGIGQRVDISILETTIAIHVYPTTTYVYSDIVRPRIGNIFPSPVLPCKDGYIGINTQIVGEWEGLCGMIGRPDLLENPKYKDRPSRMQYSDELVEIVGPWVKERTKEELYHEAQLWRVAFAMICTPEDLLNSPQLAAREYFAEINHPSAGNLQYPGAPFKMAETPWALDHPAPLLGEHNKEIYVGRLGYTDEDLVRLEQNGII